MARHDVQNAGLDVVEEFGQPIPDHVLSTSQVADAVIAALERAPVGR